MGDLEINYDTRPYLPDIFIKDKIFTSCDSVNNNTNILINSTIFIFNLEGEQLDSKYNDPLYLLYGIENEIYAGSYQYPPLYFFYTDLSNKNLIYTTLLTINKILFVFYLIYLLSYLLFHYNSHKMFYPAKSEYLELLLFFLFFYVLLIYLILTYNCISIGCKDMN